jgi:TM2 domain-containing membrane protein YozV
VDSLMSSGYVMGAVILVVVVFIALLIKGHNRKVSEVREKEAAAAAQAPAPLLIACPACAKQVSNYAAACPSCGHPLQSTDQAQAAVQRTWSPGIAALLSFVIPGAGQMYKGHVGAGLLWFAFVIGGYFLFIIPGLILHIVCIFSAATGN